MKARWPWLALLLTPVIASADDHESTFHRAKLDEIDAVIERALIEKKCPGGVFWIERKAVAYHKAFGARSVEPAREAMTEDTIFDAASLTKVVATSPAILLLIERGQMELDAPVSRYWPEFAANGKAAITIRHLLTHTSGLRPGLGGKGEGRAAAMEEVCAEKTLTPPGAKFLYSDINFIALGILVQHVTQRPLENFCATEIFERLGMRDTMYQPPASLAGRIAPTTRGLERGVVHDPTARRMGGVAGHAGLFTTAADLAKYARMFLNEGELDGVRIFQAATVRRMTAVQSGAKIWEWRGLGWDIDSPYAGQRGGRFSLAGYGHTGWTGGSLWVSPSAKTFVIFLSNRNHPTEAGNVIGLRKTLGTLAAEALVDAPE